MKLTGRDLAKAIGFLGAVVLVAVSMIIAGAREPAPRVSGRGRIASENPKPTPAPAEVASVVPEEQVMSRHEAEGGQKARSAPPAAAPSSSQAARGPQRAAASTASYSQGPLPPFPAGLPPLSSSPGASWGGPAPSALWLAGVVEGDPKLAVVRRGESRYLVNEGDSVEGTYRVTKITSDTITLQRGRRSLTLRLGRP